MTLAEQLAQEYAETWIKNHDEWDLEDWVVMDGRVMGVHNDAFGLAKEVELILKDRLIITIK